MKHKRITSKFIILLFLFSILAVILWNSDLAHNAVARIQWTQKKKEFRSDDISKISFYTGGLNGMEIEFIGKDKDNFILTLSNSNFYKSNWQGMLDDSISIEITYNNSSKRYFEYCGGDIFQLGYKGNLFSIRNKNLSEILSKYIKTT
ncbi:hypothetical protein [Clostridium folliculivorans]|uniref:Uncharacterized protein n=1 Tax=Clostridium folliculivorans TaxID=2886038 RepID=A0A9W5Y2D5_9CLOT|nr:hypothetical protein [Clostridium folliculivorans]GKU25331.1 hypothetical protein CFOLD11_21570 [Clostridium folliculivorans]GKU28352.1 hypothetical protein CFB3_04580 [Clostridium folliculivorans]